MASRPDLFAELQTQADQHEIQILYTQIDRDNDNKGPIPDHIRLFNKVGLAYGYMTDNAYIVDFKNKVEFFLSAAISVNEDDIHNGQYAYEKTGFPFLANLGRIVYQHELQRPRRHVPELDRFSIDYAIPE